MKINIEDIKSDVPRFCRKLMKKEDYPKVLEIYRGEMLSMTVDVEKASRLKMVENAKIGPLYKKYRPSAFTMATQVCTLRSLSDLNEKDIPSTTSHLKQLYGPYARNGQFREEEPLKGYRQWVLDALCERYRKNNG